MPRYPQYLTAYHGTTSRVAIALLRGETPEYKPIYVEGINGLSSLGGTYLARDQHLAWIYAEDAALIFGDEPVVLTVRVATSELLPDEDWVVCATHHRAPDPTPRVQRFLDDLFVGYPGDGWSLSDHYKERYSELNAKHGISWRDSWAAGHGTARFDRLLRPEDVLVVTKVE